jgi:hypothetical protein
MKVQSMKTLASYFFQFRRNFPKINNAGKRNNEPPFLCILRNHQIPIDAIHCQGFYGRDENNARNQIRQLQKMQTIGTLVGDIAHGFNNFATFTDRFAGLRSQTAWVLWMNGMEMHEIHQSGVTQILKLKAGRNLDFLCSEIDMGS